LFLFFLKDEKSKKDYKKDKNALAFQKTSQKTP
jgi:hypothetical protein